VEFLTDNFLSYCLGKDAASFREKKFGRLYAVVHIYDVMGICATYFPQCQKANFKEIFFSHGIRVIGGFVLKRRQ
jgi:hypothetical protein